MTRRMERAHAMPLAHLRWLADAFGVAITGRHAKRWLDIFERRMRGETQASIAKRLRLSRSFVGAMEARCVAHLVWLSTCESLRADALVAARSVASFIKGECPTCHGETVVGTQEDEMSCPQCSRIGSTWMEFTR